MRMLYSLLFFGVLMGCQEDPSPLTYLDDQTPDLIPKRFAAGSISTDHEYEFGSVINQAENEFYFGVDTDGKAEIRMTRFKGERWSQPIVIISHDQFGFNDPFLSPDENRLYYISNHPKNELDTIQDYDIWYSERTANSWSAPIHGGDILNTDRDEYYISFTSEGDLYFASNRAAESDRTYDFDIYVSEENKGKRTLPKKLPAPVNTERYQGDVYVAPNESYIIYAADLTEGLGRGDLYISFKNNDQSWSPPVHMGSEINSENHELCPFVTPDGRFLFYTSNQDIYWVSAAIIESFRLPPSETN